MTIANNSTTSKRTGIQFANQNAGTFEMGTDVGGNFSNDWYLYDNTANSTRLLVSPTGNLGIGTTTPATTLDVNGTIRTNSGILNTNDYFEKVVTTPYFTNGTPNLAVDLRLGNLAFWGNIEVEITSFYSNQNSAGKLTKIFAVGTLANNTIYTNESRVSEALGTVPDNISIGDMSWDATNSTYRIPISHIVSTGNSYTVKIKMLTHSNGAKSVFDTMTVSPLYTLTALPRNYVNYNGNVGIGTTAPTAKLDVNGTSIFNGAMSIQAQHPITFANGQTIRDNGVGGIDLNVPNYSLNLKSGTDPSAVI
jgi:hypothetical protein